MLTTTQFADDYVDALVAQGVALDDAAAFKTTFATQLTDWLGGGDAIPADLAYRLTIALGRMNAETVSRLDWLTGTATGGPNSDGYYEATEPDGTVVPYPCLAKIVEATAKGDPGGVSFTFSTTTTDSDPGAGTLRLNHATMASVDKVFFDNTAKSTASVTAWLDSFDDTPGAVRGLLHMQEAGSEKFLIFNVTGDVVDGTGYRKVPVSYVAGAGGFTNAARVAVIFVPRGNRGAGILSGSGTPSGGLGSDGDIYLDLATGDFFGPKASGSWGSPIVATGLNALVADAVAAAGDAATSETNAASGATAAAGSATTAAGSATTATTKAGEASTSAATASTKAGEASASATAAAASAATALGAPGTQATCADTLAFTKTSKTFTLAQTGKLFAKGLTLNFASAADPTKRMSGALTDFTSSTGAGTVLIDWIADGVTGSANDWIVAVTAPGGSGGSSSASSADAKKLAYFWGA